VSNADGDEPVVYGLQFNRWLSLVPCGFGEQPNPNADRTERKIRMIVDLFRELEGVECEEQSYFDAVVFFAVKVTRCGGPDIQHDASIVDVDIESFTFCESPETAAINSEDLPRGAWPYYRERIYQAIRGQGLIDHDAVCYEAILQACAIAADEAAGA